MLKSYKTEIDPTPEQKELINRTIGVSRFVYNFYLAHNKEVYEKEKSFVSGISFSKWLNNDFIPSNPDYQWIKEVSSKSTKQSIMNAERAFRNFFRGQSRYPKFKKKNQSDTKMYFVKNNSTDCKCERHRIKVPTLGWIKLKEKGYIPTNPNTHKIKSGTISIKAGRYYISVLIEQTENNKPQLNEFGLGIDLGIKEFVTCSNKTIYKNINKNFKIKKLEKKLKREQRCLSRKYEDLKKRNKNIKEGETTRQNIQKQKLKVQKIHQQLTNIRIDYINKVVSELVKTKPMWITIEDLNVKGMMKNRHLSKAVQQQYFGEFRRQIEYKCEKFGIELRVADRFYPSSKTCSNCGCIKSDLRLSDRTYHCNECGFTIDRDLNAAINLRDAVTYKIA